MSLYVGLCDATGELRDCGLNTPAKTGRRSKQVRQIDTPLMENEASAKSIGNRDQRNNILPKDVVPYEEDEGKGLSH